MAWGVMTIDRGGHYATDEEVQAWVDVATPATTTKRRSLPGGTGIAAGRGRRNGSPSVPCRRLPLTLATINGCSSLPIAHSCQPAQ
jgi:hypothetical protein